MVCYRRTVAYSSCEGWPRGARDPRATPNNTGARCHDSSCSPPGGVRVDDRAWGVLLVGIGNPNLIGDPDASPVCLVCGGRSGYFRDGGDLVIGLLTLGLAVGGLIATLPQRRGGQPSRLPVCRDDIEDRMHLSRPHRSRGDLGLLPCPSRPQRRRPQFVAQIHAVSEPLGEPVQVAAGAEAASNSGTNACCPASCSSG